MIRLAVFILLLFSVRFVFSQDGKPSFFSVKGRLNDSTTNNNISSATISIYNKTQSKLLSYGVSTMRGEFELSNIPLRDSIFVLQVAHIAYGSFKNKYQINSQKENIDVGVLKLSLKNNQLKEVNIDAPPLLVKNDTLEIYPDAFSTSENAVVEDLLKKVPGIVVWGDGQITVNGKKVTKVFVEGKRFFGGDPIIATRNLPKDAIAKIKVYEEPKQAEEEEDQLNMDILLKSKSKAGLFGKIATGLGGEKRKEAVGSFNIFNPKMQLSIFGGANNTNKESYSVSDFLRVNTYKAGSEDLNAYASNFDRSGFNNFFLTGARLEYTFNSRFKSDANGLFFDKKSDLTRNVEEITAINDRKRNTSTDQIESNGENRFKFDTKNNLKVKNGEINIEASFDKGSLNSNSKTTTLILEDTVELSKVNNIKKTAGDDKTQTFHLDYKLSEASASADKIKLTYNFYQYFRDNVSQQFLSASEGLLPMDSLSRSTVNDHDRTAHEFRSSFDVFSIFGKTSKWRFQIANHLRVENGVENQIDLIEGPKSGKYDIVNNHLSYTDKLREQYLTPEIGVSRAFIKVIGRGSNLFYFDARLKHETIWRKNHSNNEDRQIVTKFQSFLPSSYVSYTVNRTGSKKIVGFYFQQYKIRPQLYQQISLMDSLYTVYNYVGNKALQSEKRDEYEFRYNNSQTKNNLQQSLSIKYIRRDNQLVDSTIYGDNGETVVYTANTKGKPMFAIDYNFTSARKMFGKPLNIFLLANFGRQKNKFFVNSEAKETKNTNVSLTGIFTYDPHQMLTINLSSSFENRDSKNKEYKIKSQRIGYETTFTLKWPKRTTIINSLNSQRYLITGMPSQTQYLWNTHVGYRFAQKEQFEIKFSMYDILRERKNIRNSVNSNMVRSEVVNNLQQFFLVSFSYFPRKF